MRKLASIQKIKDLQPIEGADMIVRKPEFEFLRPRKFRIKTAKMRGQISQGIAFPLDVLEDRETLEIEEGLDVTEYMGVIKYEPPIPVHMSGEVKGAFPSFIPKTDETRIQSVPDLLTRPENAGSTCYVAEKLDGTSATYYLKDGEFGVCSRNLELRENQKNIHWLVARQLGIEEKLRTVGQNIAIQGELIGPGIQKNKYKLQTHEVRLFNIFDIDRYVYLDYADFMAQAEVMELPTVPILDAEYRLGQDDVNDLVALSEAKSVLNNKAHREGIVIRPHVEAHDPEVGRLTFKVINPRFLLKYDE